MTFAMIIATLGGIGRLKPGPGTWGSLVVLPLVMLGPTACLVLALGVTVLGYFAVCGVLRDRPDEDPGWIVVDEAAGMLLALAGLTSGQSLGCLAGLCDLPGFRYFQALADILGGSAKGRLRCHAG